MSSRKNVRIFARFAALGIMALAAGIAAAAVHPEGDPTANNRKVVIGIVNPGPGAITLPLRVQVRVFSPKTAGGATQAIGAVTLEWQGAGTGSIPLTQNLKYGTATDSGIWEGRLTTSQLTSGQSYTLQASGTNGTALDVVWSGPVAVTTNYAGIGGNQKRGDGKLLVRDNGGQLCSDCHAHQSHSSEATGPEKYGSWYAGCRTCHQPHDTTNASLIATQIDPPNVYQALPPAQVRFSTRRGYVSNGGVGYPSAASFANGDGSGPCQVCHTRTAVFRNNGTLTSHSGNESKNCAACHSHKKGFNVDCAGCHGAAGGRASAISGATDPYLTYSPPTAPTTTAPKVLNGGVHLDHVNADTYRRDALTCAECHLNYGHGDNDIDLNWGTITRADGATVSPAAGVTTAGWVTNPTCTNYCHGATMADGSPATKLTVRWNTPATLTCGSCHGSPPTLLHSGAAHPLSTPTGCVLCHPGYTVPLSASAKITHVDGISQGTACTDCHGNVSRVLVTGASADAKLAPPKSYGGTTSDAVSVRGVGVHQTHVNDATTVASPMGCAECHPIPNAHAATAGTEEAQVVFGTIASDGGARAPTWSYPTCTSTYCHNPTPATPGTVPAPSFSAVATFGCVGCHDDATTLSSGSHALHVADATAYKNTTYNCLTCHAIVDASNGVITDKTKHVDGAVDTGTTTFAGNSCAANYCHSDGTETPGYVSVTWGGADSTDNCKECHGREAGGIAGAPWYTNNTSDPDTRNSHDKHVAAAADCVSCHPTTVQVSGALVAGGGDHLKNGRNVSAGSGITFTYDEASETCTSINCHGGGNAQWGATLACNGCHGNTGAARTPVAGADVNLEASPPEGLGNETLTTTRAVGAHIAHANQIRLRQNALACAECHNGWTHNRTKQVAWGTVATNGGTKTPTWDGATCSNTYCHAPGGTEMGGSDRAPTWTAGVGEVACGTCHGMPAALDAGAGDHPQNTNCVACHGAGYVTSGITVEAKDTHVNQSTVAGTDKPNNGCTACHGVLAGVAAAAVPNTSMTAAPGYNGTGVDTNGSALVSVPSVGAHDAHVRPAGSKNSVAALDCSNCHGTKPTDGTTTHANAAVGIGWGALATNGLTMVPNPAAFGAAFEASPNCSTVYCHSNATPLGGTLLAPAFSWTSAADMTCGSCHAVSAFGGTNLSAKHSKHLTGYTYTCDECHAPTMTDDSSISIATVGNHVNRTKEVDFSAVAFPADTVNQQGGVYAGTPGYGCTSTYCHSNGTTTVGPAFGATTNPTAMSWSTGTTDADCDNCHGGNSSATYKLATGSHTGHVNAAGYLGTNLGCVTCHDATIGAADGAIDATTGFANHVDGQKDVDAASWSGGACGTNYCHSNGTEPPLVAADYKTATWGSAITDNCLACHGSDTPSAFNAVYGEPNYANNTGNVKTRNSHDKHLSSVLATAKTECVNCHATTVQTSGALITDGLQHLDNTRDVSAGPGITFTYDEASETCTSINCHGSGTAQWGATLACNACHGSATARTPVAGADVNLNAAPPEGLGNETLTTTRAVGAHIAHANQISLRQNALACAECHFNATHDKTKQVAWGTVATNGGTKTPSWDGATCTSTYCHAPGGTEMGGSDRAPTWTAGVGEVACGTCHGMPAALDAGAGDHPQNTNCVACHGAGYVTSGITVEAKDTHVNQSTVAGTDKPNNGCTACHGVLAGVAAAAVPNTSMTAAPGYNGTGVDTNGSALVSVPSVGAHDAHVRPAGSKNSVAALDCSNCHGTKPTDGTTTHADAAVGIGWGALATNGSTMVPNPAAFGAAFEASPNCSTVYCHSNATPLGGTLLAPAFSWTSAADMTCGSCHAVSAFGGTNLSAKHSKHLTGYTYTCDECHAPTMTDDSSISIATVGNHVNRTKEVDFSAVAFPADTVNQQGGVYAGTPGYGCTSTYCHSNGTTTVGPAFGATTNPTAMSWSTGTTDADCDNCHGGNSSATYKLATGSHTGHVNAAAYLGTNLGCVTCHDATIGAADGAIDATTGFANHVDGQKDVDAASWSAGACGTNYCHSNGTESLVAADYKTATWGSAITDNCLSCHGSETPAAFTAVYGEPNYANNTGNVKTRNSHDKHLSSVLATAKTECVNCHATTVQTSGALITDGLQHLDNTRDVSAGSGITFTYDEATETCSAISCHGNKNAQWGATLACGECHGSTTRVKSIVGTVDANLKGAPPVDNAGSSTSQRVGAHLKHVDSDTYRTNGLACAECHPSTVQHNGTRDAAWNGLATTGGVTPTPLAGTNAYSTAWEGTPTCVNYCHGATLAGETVVAQWSATGITNFNAAAACTQCHGASPATSGSPAVVHPSNTACANCHGTGYSTGGLSGTAKTYHVNGGTVGGTDKPNNGCTACHGVLAALGTAQGPTNFAAAPGYNGTGVDAAGNSSATVVQVGAHDAHVRDEGATNMVAPLDCNNCHTKPVANDRAHANNSVAMGWSNLATGTGAISPVVAPQWASPNCSSNYCHSNGKPLGGTLATKNLITWATAANMTCTSCHETAVFSGTGLSAKHEKHVSTYAYTCVRCHVNTVTSASNAIVAGGGQHVDGSRDVGFDATGPNNSGGGYNGVAYTCSNTYCHSNGQDRNGADGYVSGPSTAWNGTSNCASCHGYATTMVNNAHGAHTNQASVYATTFGCQTCHAGTTDGTPTITTIAKHVNAAADVDTGLSYVAGGAGGCTTYCHSAGSKYVGATVPKYFPKPWTTPLTGCASCHGSYQPADTGYGWTVKASEPNYVNGGSTSITANSHNPHVGSQAACVDCHYNTVDATGTTILNNGKHLNQVADVAFSPTYASISYTPRSGANSPPSCTNVSCHTPPAAPSTWGGTIVEGPCTDCHVATADVDDYIFLSGSQKSVISSTEYSTYGHGRTTGFTATGMSGNTGVPGMTYDGQMANEGCFYCHTPKLPRYSGGQKAPHADATNPLRLVNTSVDVTWGKNGNCLVCHAADGVPGLTPASGFDPDSTGPLLLKKASTTARVTATHYAADHGANHSGGEFCWDCHDPHGDFNTDSSSVIAYMIHERPIRSHDIIDANGWGLPDATEFTTSKVLFNANLNLPNDVFDPKDYIDNNTTGGLNGVCQVCHTDTAKIKYYLAGTTSTHMQGAQCTKCHPHNAATTTTAFKELTGCNDCHYANPTTSGEHALHVGAAEAAAAYGVTTPASTTTQYGYNCGKCHSTVAANHYNDSVGGTATTPFAVNVGFDWTSGATPYTLGSTAGSDTHLTTGLVYKTTDGTCATYCHSNGDPVDLPLARPIAYQTPAPTWAAQSALACTACHGGKDAATAMSATHAKHINSSPGYAYICLRCHTPSINTDSTVIETQHVDGDKQDVGFNAPNALGTYAGGTNTCTSVYCHSSGTASPTYASPSPKWTDAAYAAGTCTQCHGVAAIATASHDEHVNNATVLGANYGCVDCHNTVVSANTTVSNATLHVNGSRDVGFATRNAKTSQAYASPNCTSNYCHSSGRPLTTGSATAYDYKPVVWGQVATLDCKGCHGAVSGGAFTSQFGEPNYANGGANLVNSNSHQKHVLTVAASCTYCHANMVDSTATQVLGSKHTDGFIDVAILATYDTNGATSNYDTATKRCSNVSCHGVATPAWGETLSCKSCHGNTGPARTPVAGADANLESSPPVGMAGETATTTRAVGAHIAHVNQINLRASAISCNECHLGSSHEGTKQVAFDTLTKTGGLSPGWTGTTCTSTYCHGAGSSGGTNKVPSWTGGASQAVCGTCHFDSTTASGHYGSTCVDCHTGYTNTTVNKAVHLNGSVEAAGGDCVGCHNKGQPTTTPRRRQVTAASGVGGDFKGRSHHVVGATPTTESVEAWDCIVCHAEGKMSADGTKVTTTALHNQAGISSVKLLDADSAANWNGAGVDPAGTIYYIDRVVGGIDATEKANLDKFCLSCHDLNGALYTYNMNPADTAWHAATPSGGSTAGTVRPFGKGSLVKSASDSNLRGATASLGGATRGTVVNVKSQFDPLGSYPSAAGGAGDTTQWTKFSYHALVFFNQSRYTSAAAAYSIKNTHTFTTQAACADTVCDDTSKMYCSDCHRSTLNAHGAVNAEYLLRACDGAAANGCATSDTNDALGSFGLGNAMCYRCHPKTKYINKAAGGVHGPENAGDLTEVFGPPYDSGTRNASKGTLFGLGCIHCHGGTTYGGIHGSGEAIPFANLATTRKAWRFMNGSSQSEYSPIDTNTAADTGFPGQDKARWATGTGVARTYKCYTIGNAPDPAVSLGSCGQHPRGTTNTLPTTDNAASRPLNY